MPMSHDASSLPILPTTVVGSHGIPGWFHVARAAIARGEFGSSDLEELYADATRLAILDQENAGIDVLSDGEMRRLHFVQGFYGRLHGLEPLGTARKLGAAGYDMVPQFRAVERLSLDPEAQDRAPPAAGLGIAEEQVFARTLTRRPLKITCPGPLMLALQVQPDGGPYRDRFEIAADLAQIVNAELHRCVDAITASASDPASPPVVVQLDDPSFSFHRSGVDAAPSTGDQDPGPPPVAELAHFYNRAVAGLRERGVKLLLHLCFGNFQGRPRTARSYRTLFPGILDAGCDQFVLEFAGREMSEVELWQEYAIDRELGAGVVDVKSFYPETAEQVAGRIRRLLEHVPVDKLWLNPDCGFNHSARWVAAAKLEALAAGARRVREELGMGSAHVSQTPLSTRPTQAESANRAAGGHVASVA
ncbi:MAG: cobalamin-independent methionine synthase II family protein [Chloroflexota bacterium]